MSMPDSIKPRPYDLSDPNEVRRLYQECEGYLKTCKRHHHGTDFEGRDFAIQALQKMAERILDPVGRGKVP